MEQVLFDAGINLLDDKKYIIVVMGRKYLIDTLPNSQKFMHPQQRQQRQYQPLNIHLKYAIVDLSGESYIKLNYFSNALYDGIPFKPPYSDWQTTPPLHIVVIADESAKFSRSFKCIITQNKVLTGDELHSYILPKLPCFLIDHN